MYEYKPLVSIYYSGKIQIQQTLHIEQNAIIQVLLVLCGLSDL